MGGNSRPHVSINGTSKPQDIIEKVTRETNEKFSSTEIANFLQEELKKINAHNYDAINQHKQTIEDKLKDRCDVEKLLFGGSHSTHTDVKNISDIDLLADLGNFTTDKSSDQAIKDIADALQERLPHTKISSGAMAVTAEFSDNLTLQVLPAFRSKDGYQIPDPNGDGWIRTHPKRFSRELTKINQQQSEKVVPTIKLIKTICDRNDMDASSYYISNLALNAFKYYTGPKREQEMLRHFFSQAKSSCLNPTPDPSGQTQYIDSDVPHKKRKKMAADFARIEKKVSEAMESKSLEKLKALFKQ